MGFGLRPTDRARSRNFYALVWSRVESLSKERSGFMNPSRSARRDAIIASAIAGCAIAIPALWLVLTGNNIGRAAADSIMYHERVIRTMIVEYPAFDLRNPLTTTTPGYHIILATVGRFLSDSGTALRLTSVVIGTAFVCLVAGWSARRRGALDGILLALPLACSLYVLGSTAWMLPDNLAWLLIAVVLMLCCRGEGRRSWLVLASIALFALVFVRQIQIWAAAPIWVAAWFGANHSARRVATAILATLPAFALLGVFIMLWHGLVPPRFQTYVTGFNLATPAFILLQYTLMSVGFLPWLAPTIVKSWSAHRSKIVFAGIIGLLLAVAPATTTLQEAGRFTGWWGPLGSLPSIAEHTNPIFLVLSPLGAALLTASFLGLPERTRAVFSVATIAFIVASSATFFSWQRYHEPYVLLSLAMVSALQQSSGERSTKVVWKILSIGAISVVLTLITFRGLVGESIDPNALPDVEHRMPMETFAPNVKSSLK